MYLRTTNHTFYVKHEKYKGDVHFYSIGNMNKPKACITICVMEINDETIMTIQDIEYFPTCSIETLEKGIGSV
jgi:hypothetical protein